jgi:hypothetical protein
MRAQLLGTAISFIVVAGCASGPDVDPTKCRYVRVEDMCEASVTLDPRENESPDEATTLEIRWQWLGKEVSDVPDRVTRTHLTAAEARSLAEAIDDMGKSRCVVEQAVEPAECVGLSRIVSVEAEP